MPDECIRTGALTDVVYFLFFFAFFPLRSLFIHFEMPLSALALPKAIAVRSLCIVFSGCIVKRIFEFSSEIILLPARKIIIHISG